MTFGLERRWLALILLTVTQFMVVLDVAIVNVALPSIQQSLDFSVENLQWVTSAYALTFGGFLLLGGRVADLMGRRRVFMSGMLLFGVASLAAGLAPSSETLIGARALQGLGAAIISPAALSILTTTFAEGSERNKALGIWGAVSGMGGAAGVLMGGILTDLVGWEWIFFINVPIAMGVVALSPRLLLESRAAGLGRRFDIAGAATVTGGLVLLVYGLVGTNQHGWTSARTLGLFASAAALIAAFVVIESRTRQPLLPLRLFRSGTLTGANAAGLLLGSSIFSMFFFLSLYMQDVLGYSALRTGFAYLLVATTIIVSAAVSQSLVTRIGPRRVLASGMGLLAMGLLWFTQVSVGGSYLVDLAPGFLLTGVGLGFAFVPDTIAALSGVEERDAGMASGLINTSQQIGGAVGVAALVTVATTRTGDLLAAAGQRAADPATIASASTDGFQLAFLWGAGLAVLGLVATVALVRPPHAGAPELSGEIALAETGD
jgi:EmrB/QacA subfamily drug resistance transporter